MIHAVDFVLNVMKELSPTEPVLFQRDGSLYIVSEQGFGQVTYGLCTEPKEIQPWEKRGQSPEVLKLESITNILVGDRYNKKPSFREGEEPYFKAICFGPDSNLFSLEEITKSAQELAKLEDDGKIRAVFHGKRHNSHKYGYGGDGMDIWVQAARVMDRKRYLELIRDKEDKILNQIECIGDISEKDDIYDSYDKLTFPDCVILTPNILVSLPRGGIFNIEDNYDTNKPEFWTQKTKLSIKYGDYTKGSILNQGDVKPFKESPYEISVKLNAQVLNFPDGKGFGSMSQELLERITKEIAAVNSNMKSAKEFVAKMNAIHNKACDLVIELRET